MAIELRLVGSLYILHVIVLEYLVPVHMPCGNSVSTQPGLTGTAAQPTAVRPKYTAV